MLRMVAVHFVCFFMVKMVYYQKRRGFPQYDVHTACVVFFGFTFSVKTTL